MRANNLEALLQRGSIGRFGIIAQDRPAAFSRAALAHANEVSRQSSFRSFWFTLPMSACAPS